MSPSVVDPQVDLEGREDAGAMNVLEGPLGFFVGVPP